MKNVQNGSEVYALLQDIREMQNIEEMWLKTNVIGWQIERKWGYKMSTKSTSIGENEFCKLFAKTIFDSFSLFLCVVVGGD